MGEESKVLRIISKRVADGSGSIIGLFIATSAMIGLRGMSTYMVFWGVSIYNVLYLKWIIVSLVLAMWKD